MDRFLFRFFPRLALFDVKATSKCLFKALKGIFLFCYSQLFIAEFLSTQIVRRRRTRRKKLFAQVEIFSYQELAAKPKGMVYDSNKNHNVYSDLCLESLGQIESCIVCI